LDQRENLKSYGKDYWIQNVVNALDSNIFIK
jgi:hypothetical protein